MSAGHDVEVMPEPYAGDDGPCRRGGAASERHAGRRPRSARRWRRGRDIKFAHRRRCGPAQGASIPPHSVLWFARMIRQLSCVCRGAARQPCRDRRFGVGPSACLGDDEERAGLCARRTSPACATPGPSTTCSRRSRPRASTARQKGEFTREELEPLAKTNVESLKEFDYFTIATVERQEGRLRRSAGRLLARVQGRRS